MISCASRRLTTQMNVTRNAKKRTRSACTEGFQLLFDDTCNQQHVCESEILLAASIAFSCILSCTSPCPRMSTLDLTRDASVSSEFHPPRFACWSFCDYTTAFLQCSFDTLLQTRSLQQLLPLRITGEISCSGCSNVFTASGCISVSRTFLQVSCSSWLSTLFS